MNNFVPYIQNLDKINNFFKLMTYQKLIQEVIESLNSLRIIVFIEKKITKTNSFTRNFCQAFKEHMIAIYYMFS